MLPEYPTFSERWDAEEVHQHLAASKWCYGYCKLPSDKSK